MPQLKIAALLDQAKKELRDLEDMSALSLWETKYLGRKSELNEVMKGLKDLSPEEKRIVGPSAQHARETLGTLFQEATKRMERDGVDWDKEWIDVTAPGERIPRGHLHPITLLENEITDIFASLGFGVGDGPELDMESNNFDALNFPKDHPARDMQDTFWVKQEKHWKNTYLPRTHTSTVQVRYMRENKPPFRIIIPGRIFRNEATDASHEHTFHQFECLMVDEPGKVTVATFKYIAEVFFSRFFGKKVDIRLRPSYFPFTEPSFEFDISCVICERKGCPVCQQTGWLEIGGAGMVNQKVFESVGYKRGAYQGFAWGFGLTRLAMMKYKITDIRLFMSGDLRFLKQF
jgi:phenylalanyl-tRNA synthetase alpha chain